MAFENKDNVISKEEMDRLLGISDSFNKDISLGDTSFPSKKESLYGEQKDNESPVRHHPYFPISPVKESLASQEAQEAQSNLNEIIGSFQLEKETCDSCGSALEHPAQIYLILPTGIEFGYCYACFRKISDSGELLRRFQSSIAECQAPTSK